MSAPSDDKEFEELDHAADWAFRVRGNDLGELFANAARGIARLEHGEAIRDVTVTHQLSVEGVDRETLLVNWLNELLYAEQTNHEVYQKFEIMEISDTHLRARIHGVPEETSGRHIKAVTFHNLEVKKTQDGWEATLVVDV